MGAEDVLEALYPLLLRHGTPEYSRSDNAPEFSAQATQDEELGARLDPIAGGRRLANYLRVLTLEAQTLARACGKSHVLNLEPEDMVALTIEAAAMARVPLAGTDWIPGREKAL